MSSSGAFKYHCPCAAVIYTGPERHFKRLWSSTSSFKPFIKSVILPGSKDMFIHPYVWEKKYIYLFIYENFKL